MTGSGAEPPYGPPAYPPAYPPGWGAPAVDEAAPVETLPHSHPHPEPREYHQMMRTWTYRRWRPIVGLPLVILGAIVMSVVLLPLLYVGLQIEKGGFDQQYAEMKKISVTGLLYVNLSLAGLILWCAALMRLLHGMRLRWLSSVVPKLRWKFLFACTGGAVLAVLASVVVSVLIPGDDSSGLSSSPHSVTGTIIGLGLVVLLTTPLQCAGEEYAFRGYILQAVGALLGNRWVVIIVSAALFATAHLQFDPPLFFDRFAFGVVAAWLVIRTGGLEAGIALHVLNNYLALGVAVAFGDLNAALDPGDVSWWNILVSLTQSVVYALVVVWIARRMKVQRRTTPPLAAAATTPFGPP